LGLSISLSGRFSYQGGQALNGARLWESYVNLQGGIEVGGMQFWVFEDGTRLYYSPGLSISVSQDAI